MRYYGGNYGNMEAWLGRRQPALVYREQQGGDLGARMANALSDAFKEGTKTAVVVRNHMCMQERINTYVYTIVQHTL